MEYETDFIHSIYIKNPTEIIGKKAKAYGIPIDKSIKPWSTDSRYEYYDAKEDFEFINAAMENAKASNRLKEIPPPIIAIKGGAYGYPRIYYIKLTLPTTLPEDKRKKKKSKSKTKRRK